MKPGISDKISCEKLGVTPVHFLLVSIIHRFQGKDAKKSRLRGTVSPGRFLKRSEYMAYISRDARRKGAFPNGYR